MSSVELSVIPEVQLRTEMFSCQVHGEQTVSVFRYLDERWSPPNCPVCDAESEARRRADQDAQQTRLRTATAERLLGNAGIPERFKEAAFHDSDGVPPEMAKQMKVCREYAERFAEFRKTGQSLVVLGTAGTGKTYTACAITRHVVRECGFAAIYTTALKAIREVKDTYRRDSKRSEQEVISSFVTPDLLVIDEIGVQFGTDSERQILFEIVNERYQAMKPTILISNLALPELAEYAGDRVIDRMRDNGGAIVVFSGKSRRGLA